MSSATNWLLPCALVISSTCTADETNHRHADYLSHIAEGRGSFQRDDLGRVKALVLKGQAVTADDLARATALGDLTDLQLEYTWQLTPQNLATLRNFKSLDRLYLASVRQMHDGTLAHIKAIDGLRSLTLHGVEVTDEGLDQIAQMKQLRELHLMVNKFVTNSGLAKLNRLQQLRSLRLYACDAITDTHHLAELSELRSLDLRQTNVTDAGLAPLGSLSNLRKLQLEETKVTSAGVAALTKRLPQCQISANPLPKNRATVTAASNISADKSDRAVATRKQIALMKQSALMEQSALMSGPQAGESINGLFDFSAIKCGGVKDRFRVGTKPNYY